jgi:PST family polysaccharide transporter
MANFLAQIWFARRLGVDIIAQYATLVVVLDMAFLVLNFGFNQAVIRSPGDQHLYDSAFALVILQSLAFIALSGVIYAFAYFGLAIQVKDLVIPGLILILARIMGNFAILFYTPLEYKMKYSSLSKLRMVSTLFGLVVGVFLVLSGGGLHALIYRDFSSVFLLLVIVLVRMPPTRKPCYSRRSIIPLWRYSCGIWGLNSLERGALRLDYAVVGLILGREMLGIYYQVRAIIEGIQGLLVAPVQTVCFSFYSKLVDKRSIFVGIFRLRYWYALLAIASSTFVVFCAKVFIQVSLGDAWVRGAPLLPGLVIYGWAILWFENMKVMAMSEDTHYSIIWARITQIVLFLIMIFPLTHAWGLLGIGLATGLAAAGLSIVATFLVVRQLKFS